MFCPGLKPYSNYELRAASFNSMGNTASNWTTVTTLSDGNFSSHSHRKLTKLWTLLSSLPSAPQYVAPVSVDSNLTIVWLDWSESFSLNGRLKEYIVTESKLRVYTGFYSLLQIPRTSQKSQCMYIFVQICSNLCIKIL